MHHHALAAVVIIIAVATTTATSSSSTAMVFTVIARGLARLRGVELHGLSSDDDAD